MNQDAVRKLLRQRIDETGLTDKDWCIERNLNPVTLSLTLSGKREPSEKILAALGLRRVPPPPPKYDFIEPGK